MDVAEITNGFPPASELEIGSESYFYGAIDNLAASVGLPRPRFVGSHWMHGWHPTLRVDPTFYFWSEHHHGKPVFVWTKQQEEHLQNILDVREAFAVGAPYLYSSKRWAERIERIPNSLLIMPPHNIAEHGQELSTDVYRGQIVDLLSHFDHVAACIHYRFINGSWAGFFNDLNIPFISIGTLGDINFHNRQRCLFQRFESMTTTTLGSHVPYAANAGCRVSVFGSAKRFTAAELQDATPYRGRPDLIQWSLDEQERILAGEVHGHLFCHPTEAKPCLGWAQEELGASNVVEPAFLMKEMGLRWDYDDLTPELRAFVTEEFGREALLPKEGRKRNRAVKRAKRKLKGWKRRVVGLKRRVIG